MALYRGFSTVNPLSQAKFKLTDFELIKQDLLNAFNTRKGSRLMNPSEGCIVWDLLFEPLTDTAKINLVNDLSSIVARDPRVRLSDIQLIDGTDANQITVEMALETVNGDFTDVMRVIFDEQAGAYEFR
jgi:phage baseplate assembly protein W